MATEHSSSGVVKSFNPAKGFGFIQCDEVDGDVYFNANSLPPEVKEGSRDESFIKLDGKTIVFNMVATSDGKPQARDIVLAPTDSEDQLVGVVKSFSEKDMYGFITTPSVDQDVYFKLKFSPPGGAKGAICRFCLKTTDDGKAQANKIFIKPSSPPSGGGGMLVPMGCGGMGCGGVGMFPQMGKGMFPQMGHVGQMMQMMKGKGKSGNGLPGMSRGLPMQSQTVTGVVRSFNLAKGFGFITSDQAPGDVYFKYGSQIEAGTVVSFELRVTPDGKPQANNVKAMLGEDSEAVGSIRSYNQAKGFGFLVAPECPGDVFFKGELLPAELQGMDADSIVGAQLHFTLHVTKDNKLQMKSASFIGMPPGPTGTKRKASAMTPALTNGMAPARPSMAKRMKVEQTEGGVVQCVVKSYNAKKGWGFLESPDVPNDIYFKGNLLPAEILGMELAGVGGSAEVGYTADGKPQARALELYYE